MPDSLNDKTPSCPVCGGYTVTGGEQCSECFLYKCDLEKSRREMARIKHFGRKWSVE